MRCKWLYVLSALIMLASCADNNSSGPDMSGLDMSESDMPGGGSDMGPSDMSGDMSSADMDVDMAVVPLELCDQEPADWPSRPKWGELTLGYPDYQNVMNNFNILDSLRLLASMMEKTVAGLNAIQTAADEDNEGVCVCSCDAVALVGTAWDDFKDLDSFSDIGTWASAQPAAFEMQCYEDELTRDACIAKCDLVTSSTFASVSGGVVPVNKEFIWSPSDIFTKPSLDPQYALKLIDFLDEVTGFLSTSGSCMMDSDCSGSNAVCDMGTCKSGLRQVLDTLSAAGADLADKTQMFIMTLSNIFEQINTFTEGYHLGGYSTQRPDLHLCVGYAGHGAYAQMGNLGGDRFSIGARYTSHHLARKHRAQFRSGGFGAQAFGKGLSLLPTPEANIQIDGFRVWNVNKPFGIPFPAGGIDPADVEQYDVFNLVDETQVTDLAGGDGVLQAGDFFIDGYFPAPYDSATDMMTYSWPRSENDPPQSWLPWTGWEGEGTSRAVFSAGLNLPLAIKPIEKTLPPIPIFPPLASLVPYFKLAAGVEWIHEDFNLRNRLEEVVNENLPASAGLSEADWAREMHDLQAPDVTEDNGTTAFVEPELGAMLTFGLQLAKFVRLGIGASLGVSVNVEPGGWGGVVDLNYAMVQALNNSNPPVDAPCTPVYEQTEVQTCSNTYWGEDSSGTFSCQPDERSSCCISVGDKEICVGDWTGMSEEDCKVFNTVGDNKDEVLKILDKIKGVIGTEAYDFFVSAVNFGEQLSSQWNSGQTCADSSCGVTIPLPSWENASECAQHGYCTDEDGTILSHDVTESECLSSQDATGQGRCCSKFSAQQGVYASVQCMVSEEDCEASQGVFVEGGVCSDSVSMKDCSNPDDSRLGSANNIFVPYQCVTSPEVEVTGWEGDGCHPLQEGFPSACGCSSDSDCVAGETCNEDGVCEGASGYACMCDPADTSSCVAGRVCVDGGCHKECAVDADCPGTMACDATAGACKPKHDIPTAESVIWGMQNGTAPLHAISSYALSELTVLAYLKFGLDMGLTIKIFGKTISLTLFDLSKVLDLGSLKKAWYQAGLEARYQTECYDFATQLVTNRMPAAHTDSYGLNIPTDGFFAGYVNRYPDPNNPMLDPNQEGNACNPEGDPNHCTWKDLVDWCLDELPENVYNPEGPEFEDLTDSLTDTLDWGEEIGLELWQAGQMCVGGEPWYMWAQNANGSLDNLECAWTDPDTGVITTFPCASTPTKLLELWGCLDTDMNSHAIALAGAHGAAITTNMGQQFDAAALMMDPSGEFAINNIKPQYLFSGFPPVTGFLWMQSVQACFDARHELESRCECAVDSDCEQDGAVCSASGYCLLDASSYAECPVIQLATEPEFELCCGDGVLQDGEECDDGNTLPGDGCSTTCKKSEGNGGGDEQGGVCCTYRQDMPVCVDVVTTEDCAKYPNGTFHDGESCDSFVCQ